MSGKRRFVGPSGAVFVPCAGVDEQTIAARLESGEWKPVEASKPAPKRAKRTAK